MVDEKKPTTRKAPVKKTTPVKTATTPKKTTPTKKRPTVVKEPAFDTLLAKDGGERLADIMQSIDFLDFVESMQNGAIEQADSLNQMIQAKRLMQSIYSPEGFKKLNKYFMDKDKKRGVLMDMFEYTSKKLSESSALDSKD